MKNQKLTTFYFCFEGFSRLGNINNHIRETVSWLAKFGHKVHFFNTDIVKPTFDAKVTIHPIPVINIPLLRWIIFEVLAVAKPVVASAVGGIPEILANYSGGFLCQPSDLKSLLTATNNALNYTGKIAPSRTYSWNNNAELYLKLIKMVK